MRYSPFRVLVDPRLQPTHVHFLRLFVAKEMAVVFIDRQHSAQLIRPATRECHHANQSAGHQADCQRRRAS